MRRPYSVHDRPRYRKRTDRSKPSRNATSFNPPKSEAVEVEMLGTSSGLKRIDMVSTDPAPQPEPEQEPEAPRGDPTPPEAEPASPKAQPEPAFGSHLGRHK